MAIQIFKRDLDAQDFESAVIRVNQQTEGLQLTKEFINNIRTQEIAMLRDNFGINITHEELRKQFNEIKQNGNFLPTLDSNAVRILSNTYRAYMGDAVAKEQQTFQAMLQEELLNWDPKPNATLEDFILSIVNKTYDLKIDITGGQGITGTGKVNILPTLRNKELKDINTIFLSDLATVTQARIRAYMKNRNFVIGDRKFTGDIKKGENFIKIEPPFNWFEHNKQGSRASDINISDEELYKIVLKFKEDFKQYLNVADGRISALDEILDYVLVQNTNGELRKSIFIGGNTNDIIGLCGEIRALCYLNVLLGDKFSLNNPKILNWVAQEKDKGKQYHADITLQKFGIQVKNSIDDLFSKDISFVDSSLLTFLQSIKTIDAQLAEDILSIYEAYYFNVPYQVQYSDATRKTPIHRYNGDNPTEKYRKPTYSETDHNERFAGTRKRIILAHAATEAIINKLVGELLYIGLGDATKNEKGNLLFFIGENILFASEILTDIIEHLNDEIQHLQVKTIYNSSYTIVNFLNENDNIFKYQFTETPMLGYLNKEVGNNILLTSSFNFSELLRKYK